MQSLRKLSVSYALLNRQDTAHYFLEKGNRLSLQMKNTSSCHLLDTSTLDRLKNQALADSIGSLFLREQLINWEIKYQKEKALLLQEKEQHLRDREICYLVRLGFTTSQLAVFYGISPGAVTKANFRIQQKLQAGGMVCLAKETVA